MKSIPWHFKKIAPYYDQALGAPVSQRILNNLDLPPDGRLLDAAGGTGRVSQYFTGRVRQVVVADQTFEMLQQTQIKFGLQVTQANTEQLPFGSDIFCCVIMVDALHHVVDQAETIRELWRVLKPGGRVIIEEWDIHSFRVKLAAVGEKLVRMRSHVLSPEQIVDLFSFDNARVRVERDGFTDWVIVDKVP